MNKAASLTEMLDRSVATRPERPALIFGERERTYRQLGERTDRLAAALDERGVAPGDRVALLMHNGIEIVEAIFGCQKAGACPVPVNFRLVAGEVAHILRDSGASAIVAGEGLLELGAEAAASAPTATVRIAAGDAPAGFEAFEGAIAAATPRSRPSPGPEDLALLMYTSGTTGLPKGAMLTHSNLLASTLGWIREVGADADDVWLSGQPLFHIGGLNGLLPFIHLGATSIISPTTGFDPAAAIELLLGHAVSRCVFVPTQWQQICEQNGAVALAGGPLRTAIWGASAAPRSTLELMQRTLPRAEIVSAYGQTEMSGTTTMLKGADSLRKIGSVGKPIDGVRARIVDEELADVAPGEVGELVYRGPLVMRGYHCKPEANEEAFAGGWFHSGDLLREDDEGFLYVVDRKKDMIISGGENVYPAEVERALASHPAVADVAVVGVPHPHWVETPVAVVVPASGAEPDAEELLEHCRGRLAGYKKPSAILFADELPRNVAGKVRKRALRERHASLFAPDGPNS